MNKITTILSLLLVVLPGIAVAESDPVEQLKSLLKTTQSLTATFQQTSYDESGNPGKSSYGEFYLQRPGQFRWDYQKPFVQQIVSNSGKVWFYDADLEQVTVKKMDHSLGSTPALLLSGDVELEQNYELKNQGRDVDLSWVKLIPKDQHSNYKYILIGIENSQLSGMELSDNFGQLTRIYFTEVKTGVAIEPAVFEFVAPDGVDVFED